MPFASEAQRRWMYANEPEMAERWQAETPKGKKLPKRVKKKEAMKSKIALMLLTSPRKKHASIAEMLADAVMGMKTANELVQTFLESLGDAGWLPKPKLPVELPSAPAVPPAPPPFDPYEAVMSKVRGASESIYGKTDIPDEINVGEVKGKLPDMFFTPEVLEKLKAQGLTREDVESHLLPGAKVTAPGAPIRDAVQAAQVGAPLAAAGLGARTISKGMMHARRHAELLQALKGGLGKTKLSFDLTPSRIALGLMAGA